MSYLLGRYFSDPDLTSPPDLSPNYEYALLYDSSLWSWNGSAWVSETFPLYATFNDYFTNTLFILQNDVHYQMTFCGSYYSNITVVNMNGNRVISFQQNTNIIIIPPSVQYVMVRIGTTTTVYFYSTDASVPGWYILPTNRFIFSDNISKQRYLVEDSLSVFETTDCRLLNNAINQRIVCCGLTDLSDPETLFDTNVAFNPQLYNAPFGITILNQQPPAGERSKFTVYSATGLPITAVFYDSGDDLWKVDTAQIVISTCSFTLSGCDETGHINEVYYLSPVSSVVSSTNSMTLFYTTDQTTGFINLPVFGSYVGPETINSPPNYVSLPFSVSVGNFVIDVSSLATNPNGYFNFYTIVSATTYLITYLIIKKDSNFTSDLIVSGAASATKFQVQDPTTAPIFNINSINNTTTSYGNLILEGTNSSTKFVIKNAASNDIFNVNTISGTATMNGNIIINNTSSPTIALNNSTGNASINLSSNSVVRSITVLNPSGNFEFNDSIIPSITNTFDLGSVGRNWNNGYFNNITVQGSISFNGITNSGFYTQTGSGLNTFIDNIILSANFNQSGVNNASKLFVDDNSGTRVLNVNTISKLISVKNKLSIDGETTSNVLDLLSSNTSSNMRMSANSLFGTVSFLFNSGSPIFTVDRNWCPSSTNVYDLGDNLLRWDTVYANNVDTAGINNSGSYTQTGVSVNTFTGVSGFAGITNSGSYTQSGTSSNSFSAPVSIISSTTNLLSILTAATDTTFTMNTTSGTPRTFNMVLESSSGNVSFDTSLIPSGVRNLGSSSNRWDTLFVNNLNTSGSLSVNGITNSGSYTQTGTSNNSFTGPLSITSGTVANLISITTTASPLNPRIVWNTTYAPARTAGISLDSVSGGFISDTSFSPSANITYDLGSSSFRWRTLFGENVDLTTAAIAPSITTRATGNNQIINSLYMVNNGTGPAAGVGIRFDGNNGSVSSATIQFNGTNLLYNSTSSGNHQFNTGVNAASLTCTTSQNSTVPIVNLSNTNVVAGSGISINMNNSPSGSPANSSISYVNGNMSINNTFTGGSLSLSTGTNGNLSASAGGSGTMSLTTVSGTMNISSSSGAINITSGTNANLTLTASGSGTMNLLTTTGAMNLTVGGSSNMNFSTSTGDFVFNNTLRADTTLTKNLGSSSVRWNTVFAQTIDAISDRNMKNNIKDESLGLDFLMKLRPTEYKFNICSADKIHHGLIAQDVEEAVKEYGLDIHKFGALSNHDGNYGLNYLEFVGPMIKSIQQLKQIVDYQSKLIEQIISEKNTTSTA